MTVTIGSLTFANVFYDAEADVLYLHVGDLPAAVDFDESPEGYALRCSAAGPALAAARLFRLRALSLG